MSIWASSVPSLWAAYWAAIFAQLAHLRTLEDGVGAAAFSWIARSLLAAGLILFVLAKY